MIRHPLLLAIGMAALQPLFPAHAEEAARTGRGISEIPDPELNLMRGRYTVGDNAVAWFGVSMISRWQTQAGQVLQGTMALGMDFSKGGSVPKVTFTPSVSITPGDAPLPQTASAATRRVDGAGLQNVSGLVQSVQLAGDGNAALNVTRLDVREGSAPDRGADAASSGTLATADGAASASSSYRDGGASVLLQIAGQGQVQQWIRNGGVGQSIQLSADAQQVSNRLQIDLVRQSLAANVPLAQNVAQAITLARGVGAGTGQ
ncbi:MAG TPA: hypothetical protein DDZ67_12480 [Xanthomonadaceae bacterium]|nr:hypothetical protein [Xanthomonadaceae bacterium]